MSQTCRIRIIIDWLTLLWAQAYSAKSCIASQPAKPEFEFELACIDHRKPVTISVAARLLRSLAAIIVFIYSVKASIISSFNETL